MKDWHQCGEPVYVATVSYDFVATNNDELSIKAGQKVGLAPLSLQPKNLPGWCIATDNINVGLIPYNYVKVVGQLKNVKKDNEVTPLKEEEASASEDLNNSKETNFATGTSDEKEV